MFQATKKLLFLFIAAVAAVVPGLASAQGVVAPPGLTDWDLYVNGNGRVIYDILMAIKMLMVPTAGNTGFTTLLLLMATIGFVVLAVAAGFDPGKNILKLFTYILVVWGVTFATTKLTANIVIQDLARDPTSGAGTADYRVQGAPALVVLPAALTSQIGKYFTQVIETYFTIPGDLKMSGQSVGQFNLFGKMMQEANQFVITSPELKKSLSAYAANCVVPGLALGRIKGMTGPAGKEVEVYGTEALLHGNNMMAVLSTAKSKSILTKYYPMDPNDFGWMGLAGNELDGVTFGDDTQRRYGAIGVLLSCDSAFKAIEGDTNKHAQALVNQGSDAWAKTGVMVPYETAFQTMLTQAAAPGSEAASFGSPKSYIMQQALINSTNGAYRQAAVQTGNNELMQAAALAQAEVSQKSAWAAGFAVFNNMMGYVFTVLQAFIFAITPLIVVALMIPGLGSKIFANYAQILIWLTLWQPMLSLINYIITLFGSEAVSSALAADGGITMGNSALVSVRTNDLMVAAQFLGTMTPLLSWGIVKGAMAFTEFINHGVGSAFASQAGATAATGNLSMNNMSLDNTSTSKFSTQMSSAVGSQAVSVGANSGAMSVSQDVGGSSMKMNDSAVQLQQQRNSQLQSSLSESKAIGDALSRLKTMGLNEQSLRSMAASEGENSALGKALQLAVSQLRGTGTGSGAGTTATAGKASSAGSNAGADNTASLVVGASADAGAKGGGPVGPHMGAQIKGGVDNSVKNTSGRNASDVDQENLVHAADLDKKSKSGADNIQVSGNTQNTHANTHDKSHRGGVDSSAAVNDALSKAQSLNTTYTEQLQSAVSASSTFSASQGMSVAEFESQMSQLNALRSSMGSSMEQIQARGAALESSIRGGATEFEGQFARKDAAYRANHARLAGQAGAYGKGGAEALMPTVAASMAKTQQGIVEEQKKVDALRGATRDQAQGRLGQYEVTPGVLPWDLQAPANYQNAGARPASAKQAVSDWFK